MAVATAEVGERRRTLPTLAQLRLISGLILFAFVTVHLVNHALGLWSFEAMEAMQSVRKTIARSLPGTVILGAAMLTHMILGLMSLWRARTWRIGVRSGVQLAFGLLIPIYLIPHLVDTRGSYELLGIRDDYAFVLWAIWPGMAGSQAILMTLVWVHGCIGMHHWLSTRPWYPANRWLWYGLAVLIPALSYAGFVAQARLAALRPPVVNPFGPGEFDRIVALREQVELGYGAILTGAVAIWLALLAFDRLRPKIGISYSGNGRVAAPRGLSVLDISRVNRIPHASVCGGRARCSTCRVRILQGLEGLPPPSETEAQVLRRVGAPPNVRLACQLYPNHDITISTLLPAHTEEVAEGAGDKYHWGVEQDVTLLFCDLRGFTRMSEGRLPFDTVFLLNQFLGRMAEAIEDTGGFVDKFMGDGIMAIFGMDLPADEGARQGIAAARAMGGVLQSLNQTLRAELQAPLQMGIGLHTGPAILGRIGAAHRSEPVPRLTALGETVNLASRLEGLTKELGVQIVVSEACIRTAGLEPGDALERQAVPVRGVSQPVDVYLGQRAVDLPGGAEPATE